MKKFIEYLTESKDRFNKKNKNLTKEQKKEIISFFKVNRQAERDVEWNISHMYDYERFFNIMMKYKSGRKSKTTKMKCQSNLSGLTKDQDYVHLKLKSKECAQIH